MVTFNQMLEANHTDNAHVRHCRAICEAKGITFAKYYTGGLLTGADARWYFEVKK